MSDSERPSDSAPPSGDPEARAARLADLDARLEKLESQKRWSDVVRTMLKKVDLLDSTEDKVELLRQAGTIYIERSSNQAEAIKCFERVLELAPEDGPALDRLEEMYERRRDWERLIRTMQRKAALLTDPAEQAERYVQMAELATQRLRKPELCIELWERVRQDDPGHPEALEQLATLYERAREWGPLADVLGRLVDGTTDPAVLKPQLQKLGTIYADKLGDDAHAIAAFRRLLDLDPTDRRAQEQLKRRYVALGAWDDLEAFYASNGQWDELIRVLERQADAEETSDGDRVVLLLRAAKLWLDEKERPDRAARDYEKVLDLQPSHLEAAEALSPIYEAANDPRKLVRVYEVRLGHPSEDAHETARLAREAGGLYEARLREPALALDKYLQAFEADPQDPEVSADVERVAEPLDAWDRMVDAYRAAIARADGEAEAHALRMRLSGLLDRRGRTDEAIDQAETVYLERSDHREAIGRLVDLYGRTGRHRDLLGLIERQIELEDEPAVRRTLAYRRAETLEGPLESPELAVEAYQAILAEHGEEEPEALQALDRLYEVLGKHAELADVLERRIALGADSDEALAAWKFRLGRELHAHLDDTPRAIELWRDALALVPEHEGAREALESLLDQGDVRRRTAEVLTPLYEATGAHRPLARALTVLCETSDDPAERLELRARVGELHAGPLGEPERAITVYSDALTEAPSSQVTLSRLETIADEQGELPRVVALLESLAADEARVPAPALRRDLWVRAGWLRDTRLDDAGGAIEAYRHALQEMPDDGAVIESLEGLFARTERYEDWVGLCRQRLDRATAMADREALLAQMAALYDERLSRPDQAIACYEELLELDPTSARALAGLDALYERQGRWDALAANIERRIELAGDDETRCAAMLRLADVSERRLDDVPRALDLYEAVLELDPSSATAIGALERLLGEQAHERRAADMLEGVYTRHDEHGKLVGVHEVQLRHLDPGEPRRAMLHRIAALHEQSLGDERAAFETYARALAEDPSDDETQAHLERLGAQTDAAAALAETYAAQAAACEDPAVANALHHKAARVREEALADPEGAIAHYEQAATLVPDDLDALTALERLYQVTERYDALAEVYLRKAAKLPDPDETKAYRFRAAAVYEEILERPADAIAAYHLVLEDEPGEAHALDRLISLHTAAGQWDELVSVYERKAEVTTDEHDKRALFARIAAVHETERGDVDRALEAHDRVLTLAPDDTHALARKEALYGATERWPELLGVLEREAELAPTIDEAQAYRFRIADLHRTRLGDPERAVALYGDVLAEVPDHQDTLDALETMIGEGVAPSLAAETLEPVYRDADRPEELARTLEVLVAHQSDPVVKVELLHRIAQISEEALDNGARAFDAYARALRVDPRDARTVAALERLAAADERWPELGALYDEVLERVREGAAEDIPDAAMRAARVFEQRLHDPERAIARCEEALSHDDGRVEALEALDRLYTRTERWPNLVGVLSREIDFAPSPDAVLTLQYRLGQVRERHLDDLDGAIAQYSEILAAAPEHDDARHALERLFEHGERTEQIGAALEPLYRAQERWDRLMRVHEVRVAHLDGLDERVGAMHRIAEIAEERAGAPDAAFVWMQRALLEDPTHDHTLHEVERLGRSVGQWAQLADTYAQALDTPLEAPRKGELGARLARVYEHELGDIDRAEATYRYLLGVDATNRTALTALDRIYVQDGAHAELADVLGRRIEATDDTVQLVDLNYRLGHVLENELDRTDQAVAIYQHVLGELDPQHTKTINALETIYTRLEDWEHLYGAFEHELQAVFGDSQQADVLVRMARLRAGHLADPEGSIPLWNRVLDLRGEDPEALNALGNLYAHLKRWPALVDVLEREAAVLDDPAERKRAYADLARVFDDKLGRDRDAIDAWERIVDFEPTYAHALLQISEIHRAHERWQDVADTLHRLLDLDASALDNERRAQVYRQLGYAYAEHLDQPIDAADAYRRVLELTPGDAATLDALERLYRDEERWEDVVDVMSQRARALDEPDAKVRQWLAVADVWSGPLARPAGGIDAYQRVLELDPNHRVAFDRLEALLAEEARWDDLVQLYLGRIDATGDTAERVDLLRRAAEVYDVRKGSKDDAFDALLLAWSLDYTDDRTVEQLERVTAEADKWKPLLTTANAAVQQVEDAPSKIAICLACARWYGQRLDHPQYAVPYYRQILALDPKNVPAMQQMADLYRATGQWDTYHQVLARLVESTDDPAVQAETFTQMGEVAEERLGSMEQAQTHFERALVARKGHLPALLGLERVHRRAQRWDRLADVLERQVGAVERQGGDPAGPRIALAELHEQQTGQVDRAIEAYEQVREASPDDARALAGLQRLYGRAERWRDLAGVLEAKLDLADTEGERIALLRGLAELDRVQFVKHGSAAERLEAVLDIDPTHEESLDELAQLYARLGRWNDVIETYERHVAATPDRLTRVGLYKRLGDTYAVELKDPDHAIDSYLNVLAIDPDEQESLEALTRLYEERGDHAAALDMMGQLADQLEPGPQQVALRYRMGRILDEELGDRAGALEAYERAVNADPSHVASLEAMRAIHVDAGDWAAAVRVLEQEAVHASSDRAAAERLTTLARIHEERLDDPDQAVEIYKAAIARDPACDAAAQRLATHYFEQGEHAAALPLLSRLVHRGGGEDREARHAIATMLGESASAEGEHAEAIKAYRRALELEPDDVRAQAGLAEATFAAHDWADAAKLHQALVDEKGTDLDRDELIGALGRLGEARRRLGDDAGAQAAFERMLAEDPQHPGALRALVALHREAGRWPEVAEHTQRLLDGTLDDDTRFGLLTELGAVHRDHLDDPTRATEHLVDALDVRPGDLGVMHDLLALYQRQRLWPEAIDVIERIAAANPRADARAKYAYTVGVIARDELADQAQALSAFDRALDHDPTQLKPFEAINRIHQDRKDWKGLERAYRKMLHRVMSAGGGEPKLQHELWHQLGLIYRDRQRNLDAAAEAFTMASKIAPDDAVDHEILAELHAIIPGHADKAIEEHQWLLQRDPARVASFRALYQHYFALHAYDKAFCVAGALCFLDKADEEQRRFFEQYRGKGVARPATARIADADFSLLAPPERDKYVTAMIQLLAPALHRVKAQSDKQLNLHRQKFVDLAHPEQSGTVATSFAQLVSFYAIPYGVRLLLSPGTPGGLADVPGSAPPVLLCGADLAQGSTHGYGPREIHFAMGRHLAYYRPEHFARTLLKSHAELRMVLLAALRIAGVAGADPQVDTWAKPLAEHIDQPTKDRLRKIATRFVESEAAVDIKAWMRAVDLTANRAGLLVCDDLATATRMARAVADDSSVPVPVQEKVQDLLLYSVSEAYFTLREHLGLQIRV